MKKKYFLSIILTTAAIFTLLLISPACHSPGEQKVETPPPAFPTDTGLPPITGEGPTDGEPQGPEIGGTGGGATIPYTPVDCPAEGSGQFRYINGFNFVSVDPLPNAIELVPQKEAMLTKPNFHLGGAMNAVKSLSKNKTGSADLVVWNEGATLNLSSDVLSPTPKKYELKAVPINISLKKLKDGRILGAVATKLGTYAFFIENANGNWTVTNDEFILLPVIASNVEILESLNTVEINNKKIPLTTPYLPITDYVYLSNEKGLYRISTKMLQGGCVEEVALIGPDEIVDRVVANGKVLAFRAVPSKPLAFIQSTSPWANLYVQLLQQVYSSKDINEILNMLKAIGEADEKPSMVKAVNLINGEVSIPRKPAGFKAYNFDLLMNAAKLYTLSFKYDSAALDQICSQSSQDLKGCRIAFSYGMASESFYQQTLDTLQCGTAGIPPENQEKCDFLLGNQTALFQYDLTKLFLPTQPEPAASKIDDLLLLYRVASNGTNLLIRNAFGKIKKFVSGAFTDLNVSGTLKQMSDMTYLNDTLITTATTGIDVVNVDVPQVTMGPERVDPKFIIYYAGNNFVISAKYDGTGYIVYEFNDSKITSKKEIGFNHDCGTDEFVGPRIIEYIESTDRIVQITTCKGANKTTAYITLQKRDGSVEAGKELDLGICPSCIFEQNDTSSVPMDKFVAFDASTKDDTLMLITAGYQDVSQALYKVVEISPDLNLVEKTDGIIKPFSTFVRFMTENKENPPQFPWIFLAGKPVKIDLANNSLQAIGGQCPSNQPGGYNLFAFSSTGSSGTIKDYFSGISPDNKILYYSSVFPYACVPKDADLPEIQNQFSQYIAPKDIDAVFYITNEEGKGYFFSVNNIISDINTVSQVKLLKTLSTFGIFGIRANSDYVVASTLDNGIEFYPFDEILP